MFYIFIFSLLVIMATDTVLGSLVQYSPYSLVLLIIGHIIQICQFFVLNLDFHLFGRKGALSLYLWKLWSKQSLTFGNPEKLCYTHLKFRKLRLIETQHDIFMIISQSSNSFSVDLCNSHMTFLQYLCKLHVLKPPACFFFRNSPSVTLKICYHLYISSF